MIKIRKESNEVLYPEEEYININNETVQWLKNLCSKNISGKIRLCTHRSVSDNLHEMLIIHKKDYYVRPHKHIDQVESMFVLEGEADYIFFDEVGNIKNILKMGDKSSKKVFYNRIDTPSYHMLIIKSDFLIFHEITNGPFDINKTIFPDWAPTFFDKTFYAKKIEKFKASS